MTFEDVKLPKSLDVINSLLKKTYDFKYNVELINELDSMAEAYKWMNCVTKELNSEQTTTIKNLQDLIFQGTAKNYSRVAIEQLNNLLKLAQDYQCKILKFLKREKILEISELETFWSIINKFRVELKEKMLLSKMMDEANKWREYCKMLLRENCMKNDFEYLKQESERMKITCNEFVQLSEKMIPFFHWLDNASHVFVQLKFRTLEAKDINQAIEKIKNQSKKKAPLLEDNLQVLVEKASELAKTTEEYKIFALFLEKVRDWECCVSKLINAFLVEGRFYQEEMMDIFRMGYQLSVSKEHWTKLIDICEQNAWIKRANEAYKSKVQIHILEGLQKESNEFIQKAHIVDEINKQLNEKMLNAKQWLLQCKSLKRENVKIPIEFLEQTMVEGEKLNVKMKELDMLTNTVADNKNIEHSIRLALQGEYTYKQIEALINTVSKCNVFFSEFQLLQGMFDVCTKWRKMALQVINSRPAFLVLLNSKSAKIHQGEQVTIILNKCENGALAFNSVNITQEDDLKNISGHYCLCRQTIEGDMIACDFCGEWFHYECINLPKEMLKELAQYICLACSKRKALNVNYPGSLANIQRINERTFETLIQDGQKIPVKLEELRILQEAKIKVTNWINRASKCVSKGIQFKLYRDQMDSLELKIAENYLMKLYLENESLPVETEMSEKIMLLLRQRDWVHSALKSKHSGLLMPDSPNLISQALKLDINKVPELNDFYNELTGLLAKQEQNKFLKDLEQRLTNALKCKKEKDTVILQFFKQLCSLRNNVMDSLLIQTSKILNNVKAFEHEALQKFAFNPTNVAELENLCDISLQLGCVPEYVNTHILNF